MFRGLCWGVLEGRGVLRGGARECPKALGFVWVVIVCVRGHRVFLGFCLGAPEGRGLLSGCASLCFMTLVSRFFTHSRL